MAKDSMRRDGLFRRPNLDTKGMSSMKERAAAVDTPTTESPKKERAAAVDTPTTESPKEVPPAPGPALASPIPTKLVAPEKPRMGSADMVHVPMKGDKTTLGPGQITQLNMLRGCAYQLPATMVIEASAIIRNTSKGFSTEPDADQKKILLRCGIMT